MIPDREIVLRFLQDWYDCEYLCRINHGEIIEPEREKLLRQAIAMLKEKEKPNGKCANECECWDAAYERGKQDALKEQEAEIRQLRLALDIAKGTCRGISVKDR